jgi:TetR/AcrR family transcriptional regulator
MVNSSEKEQLILQTAMDVFIEKGRHGAKMQEIADRAGINKALLHYYYRSKEKLYSKIFEFLIWHNINELLSLLDSDLSFPEYLRTFIAEYTDLLNQNPKIPLFILKELSEGGAVVKRVLKNLVENGKFDSNKALRVIERGMKRGEIVRMDPLQVIATIVGSCLFYFISEPIFKTLFINEQTFDRNRFIEERKEAIYQLLSFGLIPRGEK